MTARCRTCGGPVTDDCLSVDGASGRYGLRLFFCRWRCLAAFALADGDPARARREYAALETRVA